MRFWGGTWWLATVALLSCVEPGGTDWQTCANLAACTCKWSSGKKTASCPSAGLTVIPQLSPDIQVLNLHDNVLVSLAADAFASCGLLNLQRVNLRASRLRALHVDTFRELRILVELDLADNELKVLPPGTFHGNERLRLLVLSGNPLAALQRDQFPPLPHLRTLELAGCRLRLVHSAALQPRRLPQLDALDLSGNLLASLSRRALSALPALKTLRLAGNPWQCNCRLRAALAWFLDSNLGTEDVLCTEPLNVRWQDVADSELTCAPEVEASTRVLRAEPGTDVSFGCLARGDPLPRVFWIIDGHDIDAETVTGEILIEESDVSPSEDEIEQGVLGGVWVNVSISNVTRGAAGEWTCIANSSAGSARAGVSLVLPRARTATARSPPQRAPPLGVLAGALGALFTLGALLTCACWHTRRRVVPGRRLTEQEKKLLDSSLVASVDRSSADIGTFELPGRPLQLSVSPLPPLGIHDPMHITIESNGVGGAFPPPPAEFALPAPYGNIFISVSVAGGTSSTDARTVGREIEVPDLLGSVGGATLPRRARACCVAVPAYDNMGPRVTAGGSSTWSLSGSDTVLPQPLLPPAVIISPPPLPEFVSL